jgi:osmoprotectant transport system permease protein
MSTPFSFSSRPDKVAAAGCIIGLGFLLAADFLVFRPNRLVAGQGYHLFSAADLAGWIVLLAGWCLVLVFAFDRGKTAGWVQALVGPFLAAWLCWQSGLASTRLLAEGPEFARISLGAGFWGQVFAVFVLSADGLKRSKAPSGVQWAALALVLGLVAWWLAGGHLDSLSILQEFHARQDRFMDELARHMFVSLGSVGLSVVVGVPLGILVAKRKQLTGRTFFVLNIVQTIPSLALFGLMIAPLAWLAHSLPALAAVGVQGIGWAPAVLALGLYALLPVVRNTYTSIATVEPGVREAGRGMGMNRMQLLWRVELPIAMPVLLSGVRIALVQNIGNTAVAALIGAGGFGVFIFQGLGQAAIDLILLGALPTITIAVAADFGMQFLIAAITPEGLS